MTEYFRVNVSSATSVPVFNEWGDQKAEIDMQLPGNLLAEADSVERARMGVMKMQVPLAKLPITSMSIDTDRSSPSSNYVKLNGYITVIPGFPSQNAISPTPPTHPVWNWSSTWTQNWNVSQLETRVHHINGAEIGISPTVFEIRKGYHEFRTTMELFKTIETAINNAISQNVDTTAVPWFGSIPQVRLRVNSDNIISIDVYPTEGVYTMPAHSLVNQDNILSYTHDPTSDEKTPYPAGDGNVFSSYTICVSSSVANVLPSLPWIKRKNFLANWPADEEYMWMLDTEQAYLSFQPDGFQMVVPYTPLWKYGTIVTYNFPESDAIEMTDIESIILVMNGTAFNQQVFPVNFTPSSAVAAQIGTIPIIEVYYPAWDKPSDKTSTLIVKRDEFSNTAPININPSLLKERTIKFKLFYITSKGEMREILIPRESPFSFQIAFELTRRT